MKKFVYTHTPFKRSSCTPLVSPKAVPASNNPQRRLDAGFIAKSDAFVDGDALDIFNGMTKDTCDFVARDEFARERFDSVQHSIEEDVERHKNEVVE